MVVGRAVGVAHLYGSGRGTRRNPLVLVFHTASRAYWNDIAQGIMAFAKTADWNLQVVEGEPDARASFGELVRFWRPDGCIFEDSIARYARSDIRELEGLPTVFINCELAKPNGLTCAITVNSHGIGELAAHELMSSGVPNFAFYGFSDFNWSSEREDGYRHALEMNGRTCGVFCRPFKSSDRTSRSRMVRWLSGLPKPCGVFAANDLLSSEVLNVCQETGQRVPDDICILGVDNDIGCCEIHAQHYPASVLIFLARGVRQGLHWRRSCLQVRILGSRLCLTLLPLSVASPRAVSGPVPVTLP